MDPFNAITSLDTPLGRLTAWRLGALSERGIGQVDRLPYSIKVLLESCLRNLDGFAVTEGHVCALANYDAADPGEQEIPFLPGRVVLQDFTGVPAVVDLAALRSAMQRLGGDVEKVNPLVPCDLVIDHSVQVDHFGTTSALAENVRIEFARNRERYEFLKWGQQSFKNFSVVPPATGIVHQVNLEYLAKVLLTRDSGGRTVAFPDSVVGTDSHTTMVNGLGVVGWGVGGIEAEAVMLGQPVYMLIPEVVGFRLTGKLPEGTTATDMVLTITQMLRAHGVVDKFVEFFGPGLASLRLPDRATIANMAPEYGATMGFFPVDEQTTAYLRRTARPEELIETVETYYRLQGLWRDERQEPVYTDTIELDISTVQPSLAGPKRPQDRIVLCDMKGKWAKDRATTYGRGDKIVETRITLDGETHTLTDGSVVIAAITSCTNTSNPSVLVAAGLVARKARAAGLKRKPWVKTSLAPGSRVVTDYLDLAGLTEDFEALGFHTVGYGCTSCIGNSGPLIPEIADAVRSSDLLVSAVLSGNRNFEGRVNPLVRPSYLASPPLVVAYSIAGTVDIDLVNDPIGHGKNGPVYLRDILPTMAEVDAIVNASVTPEQFHDRYSNIEVEGGPEEWRKIEVASSNVYGWQESSTYVQEPPFFVGMGTDISPITSITGARVIVRCADSITTDHISPAGSIAPKTPAGHYLSSRGVAQEDFNSYGSRRGNDRVMTRGTFANIRMRNELAAGTEGGLTTYFGPVPDAETLGLGRASPPVKPGEVCFIYDAAMAYQQQGVPLIILAGKDYGMGSSRDWAAKGTFLLGVRAVIAESFERIHRSNLVGMGVVPLVFKDGETRDSLGLTGQETFNVHMSDDIEPLSEVKVSGHRRNGQRFEFCAVCRLDTPVEVEYYRNGGILHTVLRRLARAST